MTRNVRELKTRGGSFPPVHRRDEATRYETYANSEAAGNHWASLDARRESCHASLKTSREEWCC